MNLNIQEDVLSLEEMLLNLSYLKLLQIFITVHTSKNLEYPLDVMWKIDTEFNWVFQNQNGNKKALYQIKSQRKVMSDFPGKIVGISSLCDPLFLFVTKKGVTGKSHNVSRKTTT